MRLILISGDFKVVQNLRKRVGQGKPIRARPVLTSQVYFLPTSVWFGLSYCVVQVQLYLGLNNYTCKGELFRRKSCAGYGVELMASGLESSCTPAPWRRYRVVGVNWLWAERRSSRDAHSHSSFAAIDLKILIVINNYARMCELFGARCTIYAAGKMRESILPLFLLPGTGISINIPDDILILSLLLELRGRF